jgi:hypothetical protein
MIKLFYEHKGLALINLCVINTPDIYSFTMIIIIHINHFESQIPPKCTANFRDKHSFYQHLNRLTTLHPLLFIENLIDKILTPYRHSHLKFYPSATL